MIVLVAKTQSHCTTPPKVGYYKRALTCIVSITEATQQKLPYPILKTGYLHISLNSSKAK
jgi:hypothetical protein